MLQSKKSTSGSRELTQTLCSCIPWWPRPELDTPHCGTPRSVWQPERTPEEDAPHRRASGWCIRSWSCGCVRRFYFEITKLSLAKCVHSCDGSAHHVKRVGLAWRLVIDASRPHHHFFPVGVAVDDAIRRLALGRVKRPGGQTPQEQ